MKTILFSLFALSGALAVAEPLSPEKPPCCREEAKATQPLSDKSLYQLESIWTSDAGREVKLGVLRGRPQVVGMFFTTCEYACPILTENMKAIERALPETLRGKVDFLLVSFDVERDTVEALRDYRAKKALSNDWTLLRGREDDVRELAALLGINYRKDARGQFSHSNVITVLDGEGVVVFQQTGLNKDTRETLAVLEKLPFATAKPAAP
jgi:protein SCO1/2